MLDAASLGQMGSILATDSEVLPAGQYIGFLCLTDVVLAVFKGHLTNPDGTAPAITDYTFPAGMYVPVPFSAATVQTGTLLAVKAGGLQ